MNRSIVFLFSLFIFSGGALYAMEVDPDHDFGVTVDLAEFSNNKFFHAHQTRDKFNPHDEKCYRGYDMFHFQTLERMLSGSVYRYWSREVEGSSAIKNTYAYKIDSFINKLIMNEQIPLLERLKKVLGGFDTTLYKKVDEAISDIKAGKREVYMIPSSGPVGQRIKEKKEKGKKVIMNLMAQFDAAARDLKDENRAATGASNCAARALQEALALTPGNSIDEEAVVSHVYYLDECGKSTIPGQVAPLPTEEQTLAAFSFKENNRLYFD